MGFFPVFMDVATKKCMIFGGGKVALRKVETLAKFDADMEIISKSVEDEIYDWISEERIHLLELAFEEVETEKRESEKSLEFWLQKADLVIAATSNHTLNKIITTWCHEHNVPVNVIDAPEDCTFLFPSIVKKGDITVGINTGGKSPIVSKQVRMGIEEALPDYYGDIARQLGELREYVKLHFGEEKVRRKILKMVAADAFAKERILSEKEIHVVIEECGK